MFDREYEKALCSDAFVDGWRTKKAMEEIWEAIRESRFRMARPMVKVQLDEGAYMPRREHVTDSGADLFTPFGFTLPPHGEMVVDTGVHVQLPPNTKLELVPKSGLNVNCSIVGWGLVDEGYSGSIRVKLYNLGKNAHFFNKGDKISQMVISPVIYAEFEQVDSVEGGERGDAGFGSTGKQ